MLVTSNDFLVRSFNLAVASSIFLLIFFRFSLAASSAFTVGAFSGLKFLRSASDDPISDSEIFSGNTPVRSKFVFSGSLLSFLVVDP